ncbi:MAG TPA: surface-adhesin E family protein, partial [Acetobacteraceae bacterium]|nr:surface-adhesin E family protein [Acetobacteraceae bacterium]
ESLPIPETGGRAMSVALVADYRCEGREWRPLESLWYRQADARGLEWRQPSRRPVFRSVEAGTSTALFLDAACAAPMLTATRPRGSRR